MKKRNLEANVNSKICVGDKVRITDGSYLGYVGDDCDTFKSLSSLGKHKLYIVDSYPILTGSNLKLKDLEFTVTKTYLNDICKCEKWEPESFPDISRDVVISYNGLHLKTCSQFLKVTKKAKLKGKKLSGWWLSRDGKKLVIFDGKLNTGIDIFGDRLIKSYSRRELIREMYKITKQEAAKKIYEKTNSVVNLALSFTEDVIIQINKKPPLFEEGVWYKTSNGNLFKFNGKFDIDGDPCGLGFSSEGEWWSEDSIGWARSKPVQKATAEELKSAFSDYVGKKYQNQYFVPVTNKDEEPTPRAQKIDYFYVSVGFSCIISNGCYIYKNGVWADTIETISLEEAENKLGKVILK